jgi:hypothetical protein
MTANRDDRRGADPGVPLRSLLAAAVAGHLRLASRLSALVWEPVLDGLAAAARPSAAPVPAAPGPGTVRIAAEHGDVLSIPFAVENRYDDDIDVTFAADPFVAAAGPSVHPDAVSFDPARVTLPSGSHLVVRAIVHVTDRFAAGEVYSTALHVRDMPAAPVPVEIIVAADRAR